MSNATQRTMSRWIHILFGLSMLAYIYGPPEEVLQYRDNFRFFFVPIVVLSGLWMWKGPLVMKLLSKTSA